jgi:hypothetical protein
MPTVTVCFTVDSDRDRDLLRWMDSLLKRKRSEAIREALRAYLGCGDITLGDVYQAVKGLERKLQTGAVPSYVCTNREDEWDEPPDVAATLDSLGL